MSRRKSRLTALLRGARRKDRPARKTPETLDESAVATMTLTGSRPDDPGGADWDRIVADAFGSPEETPAAAPETVAERPPAADFADVPDECEKDPLDGVFAGLAFLDRAKKDGELGRVGRYRVLGVLGRGTGGVVLRAIDSAMGREIALKVMSPELASSPEAKGRFLREARAAGSVSDPHVVTTHAVGQHRGLPYLVMECVRGCTLRRYVEDRGKLPVETAVRVAQHVARGLAAAHANGLLHRDVKPANVMLDKAAGVAKLTDFGLARAADDASLTATGWVHGTPQYMSPEQAQGKQLDARSDLFGLGCVLYEMLAGKSPFAADSSTAALARICGDEPTPLRKAAPDAPRWLCDLTTRLLEKSPDDRLATAEEVVDALTSETSASPRRKRNAAAWIIPSLATAAAVVIALIPSAEEPPAETPPPAAETFAVARVDEPPAVDAVPTSPLSEPTPGATDRPVKVFIFAGDSNMRGRATISNLRREAALPENRRLFAPVASAEGDLIVRRDVWVRARDRAGDLTGGFGFDGGRFGVELEAGRVLGQHFEEQVLIVKTCEGGRTLYEHFRPPSRGPFEGDDPNWAGGPNYRRLVADVRETLDQLPQLFPDYAGQGYEIAGFAWFQSWNDFIVEDRVGEYGENLSALVADLREEFDAPRMPAALLGHGVSWLPGQETRVESLNADIAAVAADPRLTGGVAFVPTRPHWDTALEQVFLANYENREGQDKYRFKGEWNRSGYDLSYHYMGSPKFFVRAGRAVGESLVELSPATSSGRTAVAARQ